MRHWNNGADGGESVGVATSNATGQRRERASVRWSGMLEQQLVGMIGGEPRSSPSVKQL